MISISGGFDAADYDTPEAALYGWVSTEPSVQLGADENCRGLFSTVQAQPDESLIHLPWSKIFCPRTALAKLRYMIVSLYRIHWQPTVHSQGFTQPVNASYTHLLTIALIRTHSQARCCCWFEGVLV